MFLRVLLTAGFLAIALTGVAALDCATTAISVFTADPGGVCSTLAPGDGIAMWLGIGLITFGVIGLLATWVVGPVTRGFRAKPEVTLKDNLARIPDIGSESPESTPASILHVTRITRRVEAIEAVVESQSPPTREVTREWMKLLRDANDLHNSNELSTEDFKEINTRLVGLFAGPEDENEEVVATR